MAPPSSIQFVEAALFSTGPLALSYADPDQKWLIRKHLFTLIQNFPTLTPSIGSFIHDDGTVVNLLYASGNLHISSFTLPIPLTVWLHENYPHMPPMVFVSSESMYLIHRDHPFIDPSGATTSPYLQTWLYPRCNLSDLMHNLVRLFSHDHPFHYLPVSSFTHPSLVSKMEALDRLACQLHYDTITLQDKNQQEIDELSTLQGEMVNRDDITTSIILGLDHERMNLKGRVMKLMEEADVLLNWLRVNDPKSVVAMAGDESDNAFEAADEKSKLMLDCLAEDKAIEDLIYALDEAVEQGAVTFQAYIRQVRILAREQFHHRARVMKLKGSDIHYWPD